jgi:hypothetical protein
MSTTPTMPDPATMPMADLRSAAGLDGPAPVAPAAPAVEVAPVQAPEVPAIAVAPIVPEPFQVLQSDTGLVVQMSPENGGEVFKGADWAEVGPKIAKAKAFANVHIKDQNARIQSLQQLQPSSPAPQSPPAPTIDPQEAATQTWMGDMLAANPAIAKRVMAAAMGLPNVEALESTLGMVLQTSQTMSQNIAQAEFHRMCPAYVDTPENSQAVGSYFPDGYKPPLDPVAVAYQLKTAYALAVIDGKITPQAAQPTTTATLRPPVMPSAGATPTEQADQGAWAMPLDQLKKAAGLG